MIHGVPQTSCALFPNVTAMLPAFKILSLSCGLETA
jgi:hypothetical protein